MLERAKELLWPLRPVLRPIWIRVRPLAERLFPPPTRAVLSRPAKGTIRAITEREFKRMLRRDRYYRGRWPYLAVAGAEATRLIERDRLRTALELGPWSRALIVGADVLDLKERPELEREGRLIVHDARVAPWPVADKAYDLFVGLQVFEHLTGRQRIAFNEVRRVARHAILSLPIDWDKKDPTHSHHMISREHVQSWFDPVKPTRILEGTPAPGLRLIYVFEDLPAPEA